jgi:hypothetical protein
MQLAVHAGSRSLIEYLKAELRAAQSLPVRSHLMERYDGTVLMLLQRGVPPRNAAHQVLHAMVQQLPEKGQEQVAVRCCALLAHVAGTLQVKAAMATTRPVLAATTKAP